MKLFPERLRWARFSVSVVPILIVVLLPLAGRADFQLPNLISTRSISGEFAILGSRQVSTLAGSLAVKTNSTLVRLEPALLAVSAEHIKDTIDERLGIDSSTWTGQIYLALHPAQSLDEDVTILSTRFNGAWMYRVDLPDVISRPRLIRTLSEVVLLEYANRTAAEHSAEIPEWLVVGLAQQLQESVSPEVVSLSSGNLVNGYPENRLVVNDYSLDLLAPAREILKDSTPLTFEQLSWPTDAQLNGEDGGVYGATAQLFVDDLLGQPDGEANLGVMLQTLPRYFNWQLAFRVAFQRDFRTPLDLEKWWALQTIDFVSRDTGLQWSPEVSREKLDEILAIPIDYRSTTNGLPLYAEISLQTFLSNFGAQQQAAILQEKLRELDLAQLQMASQFAGLNGQYRRVLLDYLNENPRTSVLQWIKRPPLKPGLRQTQARLDALDAQRRALENSLDDMPQPALTDANPHL